MSSWSCHPTTPQYRPLVRGTKFIANVTRHAGDDFGSSATGFVVTIGYGPLGPTTPRVSANLPESWPPYNTTAKRSAISSPGGAGGLPILGQTCSDRTSHPECSTFSISSHHAARLTKGGAASFKGASSGARIVSRGEGR